MLKPIKLYKCADRDIDVLPYCHGDRTSFTIATGERVTQIGSRIRNVRLPRVVCEPYYAPFCGVAWRPDPRKDPHNGPARSCHKSDRGWMVMIAIGRALFFYAGPILSGGATRVAIGFPGHAALASQRALPLRKKKKKTRDGQIVRKQKNCTAGAIAQTGRAGMVARAPITTFLFSRICESRIGSQGGRTEREASRGGRKCARSYENVCGASYAMRGGNAKACPRPVPGTAAASFLAA